MDSALLRCAAALVLEHPTRPRVIRMPVAVWETMTKIVILANRQV